MKPKFYEVLTTAIENGVEYGYNRAHKHNDNPSENVIQGEIIQAVMSSLHEWFDFEDMKDE